MYLMRPEVVESYFVLWRTTHDTKYRDWAWDAIQVCAYTHTLTHMHRVNRGYFRVLTTTAELMVGSVDSGMSTMRTPQKTMCNKASS